MSINSGPHDPHTSSVADTALTSTKDFVIDAPQFFLKLPQVTIR